MKRKGEITPAARRGLRRGTHFGNDLVPKLRPARALPPAPPNCLPVLTEQTRYLPVQLANLPLDQLQLFQRHLQESPINRVELRTRSERVAQLFLRGRGEAFFWSPVRRCGRICRRGDGSAATVPLCRFTAQVRVYAYCTPLYSQQPSVSGSKIMSVSRLLGVLIAAVGIAALAQQGSAANPSTPSQTSQSSSASSAPSQSSQNAAKAPNQPLPATPDDLRFPEQDPSQRASPSPPAAPAANLASPLSDEVRVQDLGPAVGDSSSRDTPIDLSAPADDAKTHPKSAQAVARAEANSLGEGGVAQLHAWDPHQAAKDVEVGDFYYKRGNYRAAEARYRDALLYKESDAIATFRLAECLEKMGILDDARAQYEGYLKILPHGPEAEKAEKGIARLKAETESR